MMKIYNCFPGGRFKALTMSYDDGKLEDRRLVEIFNRHGIKGTFNLNGGKLGYPDTVTADEIAALYAGHEVATHTLTHPTIARCPLVEVAEEIAGDRKILESLTGKLVRGHAYPNGSYSDEIISLFRSLGIAYGRVTTPTLNFALPTDPMRWQPTCHHNAPQLMEKARFLVDTDRKHHLYLLYVWGHSYEFTNNDNWQVMEAFCDLVGGKSDIWYATNIEIIDYMEVLNRLQYAADGQSVYNPSAQSAWVEVDDSRIVEIPGGSYVDLRK